MNKVTAVRFHHFIVENKTTQHCWESCWHYSDVHFILSPKRNSNFKCVSPWQRCVSKFSNSLREFQICYTHIFIHRKKR